MNLSLGQLLAALEQELENVGPSAVVDGLELRYSYGAHSYTLGMQGGGLVSAIDGGPPTPLKYQFTLLANGGWSAELE